MSCDTAVLAFAHGRPDITARFKVLAPDFLLDEELPFSLTGEGEHVYVQIRKTGITTEQAASALAAAAGIHPSAVAWSGLKDRSGVCRQWLSLHMPGKGLPDLSAAQDDTLEVLQMRRNNWKLRRGSHKANHFSLYLREVTEQGETLEQRLQSIQAKGVPNYFGEQRFGMSGDNVQTAKAWFAGSYRPRRRVERSLLISAARSALFNALLSRRVAEGSWNTAVPGDVMNLEGSGSYFLSEENDPALAGRLNAFDIHPTGPLWGEGELPSRAQAAELELELARQMKTLCDGLESCGLRQQRRSLRLPVKAIHYARPAAGELLLSFSLPPGAYATAVLRELCLYSTG